VDPSVGETEVGDTNQTALISFEVSGVAIALKVGDRELLQSVHAMLPRDARERRRPGADSVFAIDAVPDGGYRVVEPSAEEPFRSNDLGDAIARLHLALLDYAALHAPDHLLVSGAAVAVGSHGIVLLGEPGGELSEVVGALVEHGATLYADGYVPIDGNAYVHPATLHSPSAQALEQPLSATRASIGVIATLARGEGVGFALRECSPEEGSLDVLRHTRGADARPEFAVVIARAAVQRAALLVGEWDRAEPVAAALIERLARAAHQPADKPELPAGMQFAALVLQLEGRLGRLAETLRGAGIDAVLLNGHQVRPALTQHLAPSFSALLDVPRCQVPRALGVMESAGWRPVPGKGGGRYFRGGVTVRLLPRPRLHPGRQLTQRQSVSRGRLGFDEPETKVPSSEDHVASPRPVPVPLDPSRPLRPGVIAEALTLSAEALTVLDTLRLRTRERDFRGLPVQYGSGVHAFETLLEPLVDALLARLPDDRSGLRVIDVGTGTGIVALSIAHERPDLEVLATDVSLRALGWARRNRRRLALRNVRLAQGSLLAPVPEQWRGRVAAIVSSLPLAPPIVDAERSVQDWPVGTATGPGADGLGLVRALGRDAREALAPGGLLLVELNGPQGPWIADYLKELGYDVESPTGERGAIQVAARWRRRR
jgi:methylase of polypeptide subunit release factors